MLKTILVSVGLAVVLMAPAAAAGEPLAVCPVTDAEQVQGQEGLSALPDLAPPSESRSCSISRPCGDGNTVACVGTWSCVYSLRGVSCNGVETACPNFCSHSWYCSQCGQVFTCYSLYGDCGVTNTGCNGDVEDCSGCPDIP